MFIPKEMRIVTLQEALAQYKLTPKSVFFLCIKDTWEELVNLDIRNNLESLTTVVQGTYYVGIIYEGEPLYRGDDTLPEDATTLYVPDPTTLDFYREVNWSPSCDSTQQRLVDGFLYADPKKAARMGAYLNSCLALR